MIDFVNTPPILENSITGCHGNQHFNIAQTGLFMGSFFRIQGVQGNNYCTNSKLSVGAR